MTAQLPQPQPTDAVIVGGARTPFTRLLSQQAGSSAVDLGAHAIRHALERAGVAGEHVDMVYMGQVVQAGAGQNPARQSALAAGIPWSVPAMTINKVCLSGLTAVIDAAALSFLGLGGGRPETAEWGRMLTYAQAELGINPWLAFLPGLCIAITALGFTLLGESLREALDPKSRTR